MLPTIEPDSLLSPVRRLTGSTTAEPLDWQLDRLAGGFGNPVSLGLFRVSGNARDGEHTFPWSLVLKVAQSPANVGMADLGGGDDSTHWNYWKREYFLYESDLLARLPHGLAAPGFYGVEERPGDVFWLWIEEIVDIYRGNWPFARYELAARHIGRLSGAYLLDWRPSAYPWLSRSTLRQWLSGPQGIAPWLADAGKVSTFLDHPAIGRLFPGDGRELFRRCIGHHLQLLDALDRLPQTLGHQDAYPTNLMSRLGRDGQEVTVMLDWALAGVAPIGSDLAQLVIGLYQNAGFLAENEAERSVVNGYIKGLREMGWSGDERLAIFGFAATTVLRLTFLTLYFLQNTSEAGSSEQQTEEEALDALVGNLTKPAQLLTYLAPQAFDLLNGVP